MKREVKTDFKNNSVISIGKAVALNITMPTHYCVLIDETDTLLGKKVNAVKFEKVNLKDHKSVLLKIHHQFEHLPNEHIVAMLKDARVKKEEQKTLSEIA